MKNSICCTKCHTELSEKAKFCPECGKEIPKPKPIVEPKVKELPCIMTLNEAALFLKISRCKIYDLIRKAQIPYFPIGSHKRFITSELIEWAKSRQVINKPSM